MLPEARQVEELSSDLLGLFRTNEGGTIESHGSGTGFNHRF